MAQKRDYYEVLGVSREANDDDIRKAYRALALKYHPDRNPGDSSAEASFKEATEAYSVLNDREKRSAYDRFGHAGLESRGFDVQGGVGDILNHFQDLFADFFGGGFGGRERRGPPRGADARVEVQITLAQAISGVKHEVNVTGMAPCEECKGSGARPGTTPQACPQCGGAGQVGTQRGFIMFSTTCPRCRGRGQVVASPCEKCRGVGATERHRKVVVTIPAGVDGGQRLRVPAQGMPGPPGSEPGDLYVDIDVAEDPRFERQGYDLIAKRPVSFPEAALGTELTIELPDGLSVTAKVPSGTQPNSVITLSGKGVPHLDRRSRGALHIVVEVAVPKRLTKHAKKLLEELSAELDDGEPRAEAR